MRSIVYTLSLGRSQPCEVGTQVLFAPLLKETEGLGVERGSCGRAWQATGPKSQLWSERDPAFLSPRGCLEAWVSHEAFSGGEALRFVPRLPHHGLWCLQRLFAGQSPGNKDQRLHGGSHPCSAQTADQHVSAQVEHAQPWVCLLTRGAPRSAVRYTFCRGPKSLS